MRVARAALPVAFLVALAAWTRPDARKELVRLQLSSPSRAAVTVRVSTHGLAIVQERSSHGGLPTEVDTTVSTPASLRLFGVGDADITVIDPAATLIVDVTQLRPNAPPVQRLSGRVFHVTHAAGAEGYAVALGR
jgi:hypothetical protein